MAMETELPTNLNEVCLVAKSRRAARAMTRRYGRLLEPHGLTATQASLLYGLAASRELSISALAETLGIERTALSRNLRVLERRGLAERRTKGQGRAHVYQPSTEGRAKLAEILPLWQQAQDAVRAEVGAAEWRRLQSALTVLGNFS